MSMLRGYRNYKILFLSHLPIVHIQSRQGPALAREVVALLHKKVIEEDIIPRFHQPPLYDPQVDRDLPPVLNLHPLS
ncbi:hypothetical protein BGZ88_004542, partial [Linnemannia elongata]